jgi:hypothetical protein
MTPVPERSRSGRRKLRDAILALKTEDARERVALAHFHAVVGKVSHHHHLAHAMSNSTSVAALSLPELLLPRQHAGTRQRLRLMPWKAVPSRTPLPVT